ncbi:hypothetical protein T02_8434 [Trichinella nativa]|uniref:Uncharacterized protein n=1 Tax=Trichinella nativa TaxID=6335 RepID=A0A0V1L1A4_9BILA|nr:hypothetical protein T02_8434 [Trichinella nativa]
MYMFFHSLFHLSLMKFLQRLLKFYALASLIAVDLYATNATCCYTLLSTLKHTAGGDLKHFLKT